MKILEKLFGSEKPSEELTNEETPVISPEPEKVEEEIEPKVGDLRIVERWERNKNGRPTKKYVVDRCSAYIDLYIGPSYYWREVRRFGTLKAAQMYLSNMEKPLPESNVVSLTKKVRQGNDVHPLHS